MKAGKLVMLLVPLLALIIMTPQTVFSGPGGRGYWDPADDHPWGGEANGGIPPIDDIVGMTARYGTPSSIFDIWNYLALSRVTDYLTAASDSRWISNRDNLRSVPSSGVMTGTSARKGN
jgi:hypothetical protein